MELAFSIIGVAIKNGEIATKEVAHVSTSQGVLAVERIGGEITSVVAMPTPSASNKIAKTTKFKTVDAAIKKFPFFA